MSPDAPTAIGEVPSVNGGPSGASRSDVAWRNFANALITEVHRLAVAVIDDTAAEARLRVARTIADDALHQPSSTAAVTLGATIGIVGAVLLTPRISHGRG